MTQGEISGNYYHSLFEESPIPIWEEDFSEIKSHIEALKKEFWRNMKLLFFQILPVGQFI